MADDVEELSIGKRGRGGIYALSFVGVLLLGAGGYWAATRDSSVPERVAVFATGCSPSCVKHMARSLAHDLKQHALDAAWPEDSVAVANPAQARARAGEHDAAYAVLLTLTAGDERPGTEPETKMWTSELRVDVVSVQGGEHRSSSYRSVTQGTDRDAALSQSVYRMAHAFVTETLAGLLELPPLAQLLEHPESLRDHELVEAFGRHRSTLAKRSDAKQRYAEHCKANAARAKSAGCITTGCGEHFLVGVLPGGGGAIVHRTVDRVYYSMDAFPRTLATGERELIERVSWDGTTEPLLELFNVYSSPSMSANGRRVALIDMSGKSPVLLLLDLEKKQARPLYVAPGGERIGSPRLSHDARWVAFEQRRARDERELLLLPTDAAAQPRSIAREALQDVAWVRLGAEGARADRLALLLSPPEPAEAADEGADPAQPAPPQVNRLVVIDPESGEQLAQLDSGARDVIEAGVSLGGALVTGYRDEQGCGIVRWLPSEAPAWHPLGAVCPQFLAAASDTSLVAQAKVEGAMQIVSITAPDFAITKLAGHQDYRQIPRARDGRFAYELVLPRLQDLQSIAVCGGTLAETL